MRGEDRPTAVLSEEGMATPGTIGTVGAAASAMVALIAVGQVESIGFVLQAFGLGSVIGTAVAYRVRRRVGRSTEL